MPGHIVLLHNEYLLHFADLTQELLVQVETTTK